MDTSTRHKDFGKLIKNQAKEHRQLFDTELSNCFRVYNWNISSIPWYIDAYGKFLHIVSFAKNHTPQLLETEDELLDLTSRMLAVPPERIYFKHRYIQSRSQRQQKLREAQHIQTVRENGLDFEVNLSDYMDTGLFLDHRNSRQMLRESVAGQDVLNLFGYTGAFTVYAAAGAAASTVTVDLSSNYLDWAKRNMAMNGFKGDMHRYVAEDARSYLEQAVQRGEKYGVIILDPPTFSNSRKMDGTFDLQRDYVWFIGQALKLLSKRGVLFFSTNYKKFHFDPGRIKGAECMETSRETIPEDFRGKKKPHRSWVIRHQS